MQDRSSQNCHPADGLEELAPVFAALDISGLRREPSENPVAVARGRLGGEQGGKARAVVLTPEKRREIAIRAAASGWKNDR